jgi:hypothetical protein
MRKNLSYIVLTPKSLRNLYNSSSCTDTHSTWEIKDSNIVSCSANLTSAKRLPYKGYFLHQEYNHFKDEWNVWLGLPPSKHHVQVLALQDSKQWKIYLTTAWTVSTTSPSLHWLESSFQVIFIFRVDSADLTFQAVQCCSEFLSHANKL